MTTKKQATAAERYRSQVKDQTAEIVDVTVPSGFVFKFKRPSKFGLLFDIGTLPVSATSAALEQWKKDGVAKFEDGEGEQDEVKLAEMMFSARDQVLRLSVEPRLVIGAAKSKDELSMADVDDLDKAFLLNWILTGGDESQARLRTFPRGSQQSAVAQPNRKTRRATAKRTSRNK